MEEITGKTYKNQVFYLVDLSSTHFDKCVFEGCKFEACDLSACKFTNCKILDTNILNCNMGFIRIYDTFINTCIIMDSNIRRTNMMGNKIKTSVFERNNLEDSIIDACDFSEVSLRGTSFVSSSVANKFFKCNLLEANFTNSNLHDTEFAKCYGTSIGLRPICPEGAIFGYKKAGGKIVKLFIPEDAKRISTTGRACRTNKAKIIEITELNGKKSRSKKAVSYYDKDFIYRVGETVSVDNLNEDYRNPEGPGIYFYLTKEDL